MPGMLGGAYAPAVPVVAGRRRAGFTRPPRCGALSSRRQGPASRPSRSSFTAMVPGCPWGRIAPTSARPPLAAEALRVAERPDALP